MQDLNLRYLYEAAKLGSMRAAADSLGVAVSSVSRQISQMEADIGIALIEHGRRNLKLTEAGVVLIEHYSEQLRLQEAVEARLSDLKGLRTGRVFLAVGEGFIGEPLASVVTRFQAKFPGLRINVRMAASSNEVARMVAEDEAHLGLVLQPSDDTRIRVLASMGQPLCAIMKGNHPLAPRRRLKLADLNSIRLCLPEESTRTRQLLKAAETLEGVALQPDITSNSIILLKQLLLSGDFITLLPRLAVSRELETGDFVAIPLEGPALQDVAIQLVSRLGRRLPPAPLRMVGALMTFFEACAGVAERRIADSPRATVT